MSRMQEILKDAGSVTPVAVVAGRKVYTGEDAQRLNKAELMEEKAMGRVDLGKRNVNPDGTYASSRARNVAIDPSMFFENRYRKVTGKGGVQYEVVTDYRAIKEQGAGAVYTDNVVAHVIGKGDGGKLEVKSTKTISADEFVREFKQKLDVEAMCAIYGIIQSGHIEMTADKLEF